MLTIVIVDDEFLARQRLMQLLQDCQPDFPNVVLANVEKAEDAINFFATTAEIVDLFLVDIQMPGMNGLALLDVLNQFCIEKGKCMPLVAFVTAFDDYAIQAFDINAVDYLLKPVKCARLQQTLRRAFEKKTVSQLSKIPVEEKLFEDKEQVKREFLTIHERGNIIFLPLNAVFYFRSEDKYVSVICKEKNYLIDDSLNALTEEFADDFVRIHRSILLAKSAMGQISRQKSGNSTEAHYQVEVLGRSEKLPISRRQWSELRKAAFFKK